VWIYFSPRRWTYLLTRQIKAYKRVSRDVCRRADTIVRCGVEVAAEARVEVGTVQSVLGVGALWPGAGHVSGRSSAATV